MRCLVMCAGKVKVKERLGQISVANITKRSSCHSLPLFSVFGNTLFLHKFVYTYTDSDCAQEKNKKKEKTVLIKTRDEFIWGTPHTNKQDERARLRSLMNRLYMTMSKYTYTHIHIHIYIYICTCIYVYRYATVAFYRHA